MPFTGLSAFPLTPIKAASVDEAAFIRLIQSLASSPVDSLGILGSTGSYAYLTLQERSRVVRLAIEHANGLPVIVGIGAAHTRDVLALAEDAQRAGAQGVLLAPVSYQTLTSDEVFNLYETVTRSLSVPLCVYDNPGTTHFTFSNELHARIAQLPQVHSIKLPPLPANPDEAAARVNYLRQHIPAHVTIGISGDASVLDGLQAGCQTWYSVIAGLFPQTARRIMDAAVQGQQAQAALLFAQLDSLWALFRRYGSLRVIATIAELQGIVHTPCLPHPLMTIQDGDRARLQTLLTTLPLS
jgi:4-hydroxy-tetrahydrodipicolinate synthase